jgi:hypothetical protein
MRTITVAVRAHDIALRNLGEDALGSCSPDQSRHAGNLGRPLTMIKVHGARRIPSSAVGARHIAELIEQRRLLSPPLSASSCAWIRRVLVAAKPIPVPVPGPHSMAGSTDDLALGDFVQSSMLRRAHCSTARQAEPLDRRIEVVKVHLVRSKGSSAVGARNLPEGPQLATRRRLSCEHALSLPGAMLPVPPMKTRVPLRAGRSVDDPNGDHLIRSFADLDDRGRREAAFYGSDDWRRGPREGVLACIETYVDTVIELDGAAVTPCAPDRGAYARPSIAIRAPVIAPASSEHR